MGAPPNQGGGDGKKFEAPAALRMVLKTWPVPWGFRICAWFLKLDNGKMVSIPDEQTHPVPYYNIDYDYSKKKKGDPIEKAYGRKSFDPWMKLALKVFRYKRALFQM